MIRLKRGTRFEANSSINGGTPSTKPVFSRLHFDAASLWWRGFGVEAKAGDLNPGLAKRRNISVHFLDSSGARRDARRQSRHGLAAGRA